MKRMATAEGVASFALALASDDFPFMTGAQVVSDEAKTAQEAKYSEPSRKVSSGPLKDGAAG
jgi:hypothetical protein